MLSRMNAKSNEETIFILISFILSSQKTQFSKQFVNCVLKIQQNISIQAAEM